MRVASDEALADRISRGGIDAFLEAWRGLPLFRSLETTLSPEELGRLEAQRASNDPSALAAVLRGLGTGRQPSLWASLPSLARPMRLRTYPLPYPFFGLVSASSATLPAIRYTWTKSPCRWSANGRW